MKKFSVLFLFLLLFLTSSTPTRAYPAMQYITASMGLQLMPMEDPPVDSIFEDCLEEEDINEMNLGKWTCGDKSTNPTSRGAVQGTFYAMGTLYQNPPAATSVYIADVLHNLNPSSPAYAQGVGYASLQPVLQLWKIFRDIAYFIFVIIFIIVGFAIMFRAKLNPQTVVNIENALPRLIITLILITFSYAIAGFMIDLMYISIMLILTLFGGNVFSETSSMQESLLNQSIVTHALRLIGNPNDSISGDIGDTIVELLEGIATGIPGIVKDIFSWFLGVVLYLVIAVVFLVQAFRTFFALLTSYIQILFLVIFSPLQILMTSIQGPRAFTGWLKSLVGNLAVFPAVIVALLIAFALKDEFGSTVSLDSGGFAPPLLRTNAGNLNGLIILGIVLFLPEVVNQVKSMVGAGGGGQGGGGGGFLGGFAAGAAAGIPGAGLVSGGFKAYTGAAMETFGRAAVRQGNLRFRQAGGGIGSGISRGVSAVRNRITGPTVQQQVDDRLQAYGGTQQTPTGLLKERSRPNLQQTRVTKSDRGGGTGVGQGSSTSTPIPDPDSN